MVKLIDTNDTRSSAVLCQIYDGLMASDTQAGMPGFSARRMKTQGWWSSSTAYLTFEDVEVPVSNLIGEM